MGGKGWGMGEGKEGHFAITEKYRHVKKVKGDVSPIECVWGEGGGVDGGKGGLCNFTQDSEKNNNTHTHPSPAGTVTSFHDSLISMEDKERYLGVSGVGYRGHTCIPFYIANGAIGFCYEGQGEMSGWGYQWRQVQRTRMHSFICSKLTWW